MVFNPGPPQNPIWVVMLGILYWLFGFATACVILWPLRRKRTWNEKDGWCGDPACQVCVRPSGARWGSE